jgi:hypothetical protein
MNPISEKTRSISLLNHEIRMQEMDACSFKYFSRLSSLKSSWKDRNRSDPAEPLISSTSSPVHLRVQTPAPAHGLHAPQFSLSQVKIVPRVLASDKMEDKGPTILAVMAVFYALCFITVALRCYVRAHIVKDGFGIDDGLCVFAMVCTDIPLLRTTNRASGCSYLHLDNYKRSMLISDIPRSYSR